MLQSTWNSVTESLRNATTTTSFASNVALLVTADSSLREILLQYFFKAAHTKFTRTVSPQFQILLLNKQKTDPHVTVPKAIELAHHHWTRWCQIGLELSSAISQAQQLPTEQDYTSVQLLASFNVAVFETDPTPTTTKTKKKTPNNRPRHTTEQQFYIVVEQYFRDVFNETHRSAGFGLEDEDEEEDEDEDSENDAMATIDQKKADQTTLLMNTFGSNLVVWVWVWTGTTSQ